MVPCFVVFVSKVRPGAGVGDVRKVCDVAKQKKFGNIFLPDKNARCERCSAVIQRSGNNTNLKVHLRFKHGVVPIPKSAGTTAKISTDNGQLLLEELIDNPDPAPSQPTSSKSADKSPPIPREEIVLKRLKTVAIAHTLGRQASLREGGTANKAITEAMIYVIVKDGLPFNTSEKDGFKNFIRAYSKAGLIPLYKGISKQTLSRTIDANYILSEKVKEILKLL